MLKSGFEAMGRTVMPGNCALMGATRLASGIFQQPRDASPPLELAFSACVSLQRVSGYLFTIVGQLV